MVVLNYSMLGTRIYQGKQVVAVLWEKKKKPKPHYIRRIDILQVLGKVTATFNKSI